MNTFLGGSDPKGAERATQAMLKMRKIDLAQMEAAYRGA
jgi:predicted 3-demethylubiquinone-9 3-methyltransferase (glyoxalase superfamily)